MKIFEVHIEGYGGEASEANRIEALISERSTRKGATCNRALGALGE